MSLKITKASLASRAIRKKIGNNGIRKIPTAHPLAPKDGGNIFIKLWNAATGLLGTLFKAVGAIGNIAVTAFTWLRNGYEALVNFDWNASDSTIKKGIAGRYTALSSIWGGFAGKALGLVVTIGIGYGLGIVCPVIGGGILARAIAGNLIQEKTPELLASFQNALKFTAQTVAVDLGLRAYMGVRDLIKRAPLGVLQAFFGKNAAFIKNQWGNEGGATYTLRKWGEDRVESVSNANLRAFFSAAADEFEDELWENGYIIANSLDEAIQNHRNAIKKEKGKRRIVRIVPDKRTIKKKGKTVEANPEAIVLVGSEEELKHQLPLALTQARIVQNKDVGQIVGQPIDDYLQSAKPRLRSLHLVFKSKEKPPWVVKDPSKTPLKVVELTVPDPKKGLDWAKIKLAAKKYTWGKFRATAHLDNGRQMVVYGSSAKEAETQLKLLLTLSTAQIVSLNITEEREKKNVELNKKPTLVYPAYATLTTRVATSDPKANKNLLTGKYNEDRVRIDLWTDTEPPNSPKLK